jgi:hypothetical protein
MVTRRRRTKPHMPCLSHIRVLERGLEWHGRGVISGRPCHGLLALLPRRLASVGGRAPGGASRGAGAPRGGHRGDVGQDAAAPSLQDLLFRVVEGEGEGELWSASG